MIRMRCHIFQIVGFVKQNKVTRKGNRRTYGSCPGTSTELPLSSDLKMSLPIVHHPLFSAPQLPANHRFPMAVFQGIYGILVEQGLAIPGSNVYAPKEMVPAEQLSLVHEVAYLKRFLDGTLDPVHTRRIGFGSAISCPKLIGRTQAEVAGTLLTAELALKHGLAVSTAGGTHHAFRAAGSGFCILNDLAVTSEILLQRGQVDRVLILDLDVHQGDGTAAIFQDRRDVFTLSVHAAQNFPSRKQHSHLDIALPDGTEDETYLKVVSESLAKVLQSFKPSLVLYDAGVDTHKDDELGRLALTDQGIVRRERLVFDTCLGHDVPVAAVVGGGYSQDLNELARRHCFMHRAAFDMWNLYKL